MLTTELNTVTIPEDDNLRRQIRKPLPSQVRIDYEQGLLGEYDSRTIFYDVFVHENAYLYRENFFTRPPNCATIIAIGPALLNLEESLLPVTIDIGIHTLRMRKILCDRKMCIFTAELPKPWWYDSPKIAKINFANGFACEIQLRAPTPLVGNTVVTMQKDNKIEWLKDWAAYYRSQSFIEHAVIYDNNSANQTEMTAELDGIATVIPWNFPFGILNRGDTRYVQTSALNHFKIRYLRKSMLFNFDIDELLVVKNERAFRLAMRRRTTRFNNYTVPYIPPSAADYSFADFTKRAAEPRNLGCKYMARSDLRSYCKPHVAALYEQINGAFPLSTLAAKMYPKFIAHGKILPVEHAYFLHYAGITSNWRSFYHDRLQPYRQGSTDLADDYSVADAFRQINRRD